MLPYPPRGKQAEQRLLQRSNRGVNQREWRWQETRSLGQQKTGRPKEEDKKGGARRREAALKFNEFASHGNRKRARLVRRGVGKDRNELRTERVPNAISPSTADRAMAGDRAQLIGEGGRDHDTFLCYNASLILLYMPFYALCLRTL